MKLIQGYPGSLSQEVTPRETEHRAIARRLAAEGMVLLENDGTLPLKPGTRVALYGIGVLHPVVGGTGSGAVNVRDSVSIRQGFEDAGFTVANAAWLDAYEAVYAKAFEDWKQSIYDMSIPGDFNSFYTAHSSHPMQAPASAPITGGDGDDVAVYVISRISGEGADRHPVKGDWFLSDVEEEQLTAVCAHYPKVVAVLNIGGVMDLSFLERWPIVAALLMSQAGQEGGHSVTDVLSGAVNPSGRLTETWAKRYEDYPCHDTFSHMNGNIIEEKYREGIYVGYRWFDAFEIAPRYPFGFGRSYTRFGTGDPRTELTDRGVSVTVTVTNEGDVPGRDVVFLFAACPDGIRRKERKRLIAFAKTPLLGAGESAELKLEAAYELLASYHAGKSAWFMDKGEYRLLIGSDAENVRGAAVLTLAETLFGEKQHRICPLLDALPEFTPETDADRRWAEKLNGLFGGGFPVLAMDAHAGRALEAYSKPSGYTAPKDPLLETLTVEEKARLCCGEPARSHVSIIGNAGQRVPGSAGETTNALEKHGVPPTVLADGPAGLRVSRRYEVNPRDGSIYGLDRYEMLENRFFQKEIVHEGSEFHYQYATAIPVGTLLAQSFDPETVAEAGRIIAREMEAFGVTWWLAPGMNIHRNPLCGRNFEYYSEDPLAAGLIAAAITRGVQETPGAAVTIKHYACNNQEDNRRGVSSIVSERALREIYLKGFEIAIRLAQPHAIMTSYNKVNGVHTANSRDLCTVAAREEWGFVGIIMTDWTTTNQEGGSSAAKCVAAGNDLTMPGLQSDIREIVEAVNEEGEQSLRMEDLDACCGRMLRMIRLLT